MSDKLKEQLVALLWCKNTFYWHGLGLDGFGMVFPSKVFLHPMMNHLSPDERSLFQDDSSTIQSALWLLNDLLRMQMIIYQDLFSLFQTMK